MRRLRHEERVALGMGQATHAHEYQRTVADETLDFIRDHRNFFTRVSAVAFPQQKEDERTEDLNSTARQIVNLYDHANRIMKDDEDARTVLRHAGLWGKSRTLVEGVKALLDRVADSEGEAAHERRQSGIRLAPFINALVKISAALGNGVDLKQIEADPMKLANAVEQRWRYAAARVAPYDDLMQFLRVHHSAFFVGGREPEALEVVKALLNIKHNVERMAQAVDESQVEPVCEKHGKTYAVGCAICRFTTEARVLRSVGELLCCKPFEVFEGVTALLQFKKEVAEAARGCEPANADDIVRSVRLFVQERDCYLDELHAVKDVVIEVIGVDDHTRTIAEQVKDTISEMQARVKEDAQTWGAVQAHLERAGIKWPITSIADRVGVLVNRFTAIKRLTEGGGEK